jgi:alpha-L-rhamnosidase
MYNYSLGIQRHPQKTAFKEFILKPSPDPSGQITTAKGYYDSMYGRISSEWKSEGSKTTYKFTVPANTSATLYLPANKEITESGKRVKAYETEGNKVLISLTSGAYVFEVK